MHFHARWKGSIVCWCGVRWNRAPIIRMASSCLFSNELWPQSFIFSAKESPWTSSSLKWSWEAVRTIISSHFELGWTAWTHGWHQNDDFKKFWAWVANHILEGLRWFLVFVLLGLHRSMGFGADQITVHYPVEFGHTLTKKLGRGVPKSIFGRFGSISEIRTHQYHQIAQNFETNPKGPVPGYETQIFRRNKLNFLIGVRILVGRIHWNSMHIYKNTAY